VARLAKLSAAHLQGVLVEGDEIVEVNGQACDNEVLKKELECNGNLFGSSVLVTIGIFCVVTIIWWVRGVEVPKMPRIIRSK